LKTTESCNICGFHSGKNLSNVLGLFSYSKDYDFVT